MIFAHDTEEALESTAALVNTVFPADERLPDLAALDDFVRRQRWSGRRDHDAAELAAVQALRPLLREFWQRDEDGIVELINRLLREGQALPQLVRHDGWDYHIHATPADAPLATRMAVEAALAMADVVRSRELDRLRVCAYPGCEAVLVDLSKNRSRRYCDANCGNRVAVAAYRARKAGKG